MDQDFLYLSELEAACRLGITQRERAAPQTILVSLSLGSDLKKAGLSDNFQDALDYAAIAKSVKAVVQRREYNLMEAVAESIGNEILSNYRVTYVEVRVEKRILPGAKGAGVVIRRSQ